VLGWKPKTDFKSLVDMMIESDMRLAEKELVLREAGHEETPRIGYR